MHFVIDNRKNSFFPFISLFILWQLQTPYYHTSSIALNTTRNHFDERIFPQIDLRVKLESMESGQLINFEFILVITTC